MGKWDEQNGLEARKRKLSQNMLKLLDRRGLTQRELARRTGISRVTISYYINEHNFPNTENISRIAKALCVNVSELLGNKILSIDEENQFLSCFREMRRIYPEETLIIMSPTTYRGYDLKTGKKMILKVEEVDWR